jgi:hypothetical protein
MFWSKVEMWESAGEKKFGGSEGASRDVGGGSWRGLSCFGMLFETAWSLTTTVI